MTTPLSLHDLVERFGRCREQYHASTYNETQLRREFVDPFFEVLGWDVANRQGYAEAYKDVVHNWSVTTDDGRKEPDYAFRIGGTNKFFVEAKKPSINVRDDIGPALQLRRYAWNQKLGLGIVTDFEEFAIYDCRVRPKANDKSTTARLFYCTFDQYPQHWEHIAGLFSKQSVLRGSFDEYADNAKRKRGTETVDDAFLEDLTQWRVMIAKSLQKRNDGLSHRDLNHLVATTIDRLIFLRIAEDRDIEPYGRLRDLARGPGVYKVSIRWADSPLLAPTPYPAWPYLEVTCRNPILNAVSPPAKVLRLSGRGIVIGSRNAKQPSAVVARSAPGSCVTGWIALSPRASPVSFR